MRVQIKSGFATTLLMTCRTTTRVLMTPTIIPATKTSNRSTSGLNDFMESIRSKTPLFGDLGHVARKAGRTGQRKIQLARQAEADDHCGGPGQARKQPGQLIEHRNRRPPVWLAVNGTHDAACGVVRWSDGAVPANGRKQPVLVAFVPQPF